MANNKVVYGNTPLIDLTTDTATADKVVYGSPFMGRNGQIQTGTMQASGATASGTNITISGYKYQPPAWSTGSDAEIVNALKHHYLGHFDLRNYWSAGDTRTFTMTDGNTVDYMLTASTDFIFGLTPTYITYTQPWGGGSASWNNSSLRSWCNSTYLDLFPEPIKEIFKINSNGDYFTAPYDSVGALTDKEGNALTYWVTIKPQSDRDFYVDKGGTRMSTFTGSTYRGAFPYGQI